MNDFHNLQLVQSALYSLQLYNLQLIDVFCTSCNICETSSKLCENEGKTHLVD